jgi:hypothetical protein
VPRVESETIEYGRDLNSRGYTLGVAGALLGVVAGIVQWTLGNEIPEWTGNKLHAVRLGIITVLLSLASLVSVRYLEAHREGMTLARVAAGFLILATAVICFTTVGRLWYVPGPLLIASLVLLLRV